MKNPSLARLALVGLILTTTATARAGDRETPTADALFQAGREAMGRGDIATACARFAESHRLDPAPGTLLNLGQCEEKQGKLATAQAHVTEALEKLPPGDFRLAFAEKQLESLKKKVPTVTVTLEASSAGAHVQRDGLELRPGAFGVPLPLDPGKHVFVVSAAGRAGSRREVDLHEGEHLALAVDAGPVGDHPSSPASAHAEQTDGSSGARRTVAIGALALGGVGIVTGAITGILTATAASTYKEHCVDARCDTEGADAASRGRTVEIISPIALGVGALGLGVGTYLLLTSKGSAKTGVTVAPQLSSREGSLSLVGRF